MDTDPFDAGNDGPAPRIDPPMVEAISAALRTEGIAVVHAAIPPSILDALHSRVQHQPRRDFGDAGIGRDDDYRHRESIRNDRIIWLDPSDEPTAWYFAWIESLRLELNRLLFLGLFDYECHLAWYPVGSFYRRHLDAFRGMGNRKVSTVLYLNQNWTPRDGGELVVYRPASSAAPDPPTADVDRIVAPSYGTLVLFLSEEFPHEVLLVNSARYSIAGWFRVNASSSDRVDPPVVEAVP